MLRTLYPWRGQRLFQIHRLIQGTVVVLGGIVAGGCSGAAQRGDDSVPVRRGLDESDRFLSTSAGRSAGVQGGDPRGAVALVNGEEVSLEEMRGSLLEASGALVLEEVALERLLVRECERAGVVVTEASAAVERRAFIEALTGLRGAADSSEAERLLAQVRTERGLGDLRFAALLRRNAMLRALVAPGIRLTPELLSRAYELRFGVRYRCRLITAPTLTEIVAAKRRVDGGELFSVVAAEVSSDSSAQRGGLLPPISAADTTWPESIRSAVPLLTPGRVSDPIALDGGYALLLLDEVLPRAPDAPGTVEGARSILEEDVRREQERSEMARLARRLLTEAQVSVIDRGLERAWRRRVSPEPR